MINHMFLAKSAYFNFERKMQVIANNIMNAQTVGYHKRTLQMESIFPTLLERASSEYAEGSEGVRRKRKQYIEYGQGIRIADISKSFQTGTIEMTTRELDVSIEGKGFLQFQLPDGTTAFSRAGNLQSDAEGNVLNMSGHPLEPALQVPTDTQEIIINQQGTVFARIPEEDIPVEVGQIFVSRFENPNRLKDIGQNLYRETDGSGPATAYTPGEGGGYIRQRSLEISNVNIIEEMMQMLLCQRAFQLTNSCVSGASSMIKEATNIGR